MVEEWRDGFTWRTVGGGPVRDQWNSAGGAEEDGFVEGGWIAD